MKLWKVKAIPNTVHMLSPILRKKIWNDFFKQTEFMFPQVSNLASSLNNSPIRHFQSQMWKHQSNV